MSDELVLVARDGRVGVVLMNRPRQLNALSGELMAAVVSSLLRIDPATGKEGQSKQRAPFEAAPTRN